ncbi:terpene synthase family protein [Anseongella ginsenosidimutans]|nr:hypothetical protein [Anseongella ginsenosidimutans]QEC52896.1 hypothetical protein FRZ59_11495 [Anseongella ginsenosidimutans]
MNTAAQMIHYPFEKGINPEINFLREWAGLCIQWQYTCLSAADRKVALETNYGNVAAYYYPTASFKKVLPICRWMIYVGCYDDTFGTRSRNVLERVNARVNQVYRGERALSSDTGLEGEFLWQVERIMKEFRPFSSTEWEQRFAANNKLFLDALVTATDYNYREKVRYPSLEEYLAIRQNIVAVYPCTNMAEIVADFILPPEVEQHPVIKRINQLTTLLMAFCNDFFSVERERRDHEAMNLILVIEHERNCSFTDACAAAASIHDRFVSEFQKLRSDLPDFGELNASLERYISTLELMIHGNLLWHLGTTRHRV